MPLMPGLQHLGGKQTRAAAQRVSMRDDSAAMAELSRNCIPAVELLNSKTMLTKILLTHITKLNTAFKLTLPIPIGL